MKRIDAKIWLLLVLVVPLCGSTCTFHSTSGNGSVHFAVCVPSSPACLDPGTRPPPDADTTDVDGPIRIASQTTDPIDLAIHTASSFDPTASLGLDAHAPEFEFQIDGLEIASQSEPVPALGPLSIAILVSWVGVAAFWRLRTATASA